MSWLTRLLATRNEAGALDPALREALARWQALPAPGPGLQHFESRYVVLNTEASGFDPDTDHVLAVGGVAIDGGLLSPQESFYAKLEPDPATALANLLTFAGAGPVVVYNSGVNRDMLERALAQHLAVEPEWLWIDLYWLLPALYGERIAGPARLADWMKTFGIETFQRHHALGDAWAIAQLMLAAQPRAVSLGLNTPRSLAELERSRRHLRPHG